MADFSWSVSCSFMAPVTWYLNMVLIADLNNSRRSELVAVLIYSLHPFHYHTDKTAHWRQAFQLF